MKKKKTEAKYSELSIYNQETTTKSFTLPDLPQFTPYIDKILPNVQDIDV